MFFGLAKATTSHPAAWHQGILPQENRGDEHKHSKRHDGTTRKSTVKHNPVECSKMNTQTLRLMHRFLMFLLHQTQEKS